MWRRYREYPDTDPNYDALKPLLKTAFKDLRRDGFIARMNFSCCSGCAGTEIANDIEDMPKKKRQHIKGCVFWHHQDETGFRNNGDIYIRYGDIDTAKYGTIGLSTKECGERICEVFKKHEIPFKWDGKPDSCIHVGVKENA